MFPGTDSSTGTIHRNSARLAPQLCWAILLIVTLPAGTFAVDSDGDGIPDEFDACPATPPGTMVDPSGRPAADFNHDCVVDAMDLHGFVQQLLTPPGDPAPVMYQTGSPTAEISGYFGITLAGVPDVDGDGLTDLLAGAKLENPSGAPNDAGRAHLYSGRSMTLLRSFASPNQQADGRFGWGVGAVPDIDGDGYGDVIIGAPLESPAGFPPQSGRAYLFSGATGAHLHTLVSPTPRQGGLFGYAVAGIRDLDGDGFGDAIVGGWHESPTGSPIDSGRAHVFSGATGTLLYTMASPQQTVAGYFGISVSSVPDVNGDAVDDIVIGAPGDPPGFIGAGRAYVFSGSDGSHLSTLISVNAEPLGNFGTSVSGVPDVNGDGKGDVLVGASQETAGGVHDFGGRAYLYSGATGLPLRTFQAPTPQSFSLFGSSVAGVADIDGDGSGDLIIGASDETASGSPAQSGRAYVFSGATGALIRALTSPNADTAGKFGFAVAGLADATGDRRGDVAVCGLFENPAPYPNDSGMIYLFNLADSDVDGVPDTNDVCANTPQGTPVDRFGRPAADFSGDCLVTLDDLEGFVNLLLGL